MELNGILLQAKAWDMKSETGEFMSGCLVFLGMPSDNPEIVGYELMRLSSMDRSLIQRIDRTLAGKNVTVECTMKMSGKNLKAVPISIRPFERSAPHIAKAS